MQLFRKLSGVIAALYGAIVVGLAAAFMHVWQTNLDAEASARMLAALGLLAFHCIALLTLPNVGRLFIATALLWHLGIWLFCYTLLAGALQLPFYFSALAPYGGQSFILGWLVLAIALWRRN
ncbi:DUF423 domain-containing protein [Alishewanella tabrizica]|uniref:DUF423 domain-containing protein n=1 Tax=Alishewanella tabrizica TaxID=671278 RepID=A0ABQ2WG99_9ALTE|nr:hypothetical protein [Alishewanella tabrizica]GGW54168.1 hypothetical protein GCM10008111_07980 [Alishewanella tabrizica]